MFLKTVKINSKNAYEYIIAGLGNPGARYEMTRHNAGFLAIDLLAMSLNTDIKRLKFHALVGDGVINGRRCLLMKPQTMMNLSGNAVREAAAFYKIPVKNIIVLYDDVSLNVGNQRIRRKGSAGGHNGVKSIIEQLGSEDFPRVKIGVGKKPSPEYDLADWVLSKFTKSEHEELKKSLNNASEAVKLITDGSIDDAMNKYNN